MKAYPDPFILSARVSKDSKSVEIIYSGTAVTPSFNEMSLRDYFAAKALQGMLACPDIGATYELFAQEAYQHADAMIDARSK